MTAKDLKEILADVPDDWAVVVEKPEGERLPAVGDSRRPQTPAPEAGASGLHVFFPWASRRPKPAPKDVSFGIRVSLPLALVRQIVLPTALDATAIA